MEATEMPVVGGLSIWRPDLKEEATLRPYSKEEASRPDSQEAACPNLLMEANQRPQSLEKATGPELDEAAGLN